MNGQRYYYRLEDVDTATVSTFHGPVSAVPASAVPAPPPGGGGPRAARAPAAARATSQAGPCPSWVLSAYAQAAPGGGVAVLIAPPTAGRRPSRSASWRATRERRPSSCGRAAFYAVKEPAGTVRVFAPRLRLRGGPTAPALPVRRALVEAAVGRKARLASVEAVDLRGFPRLRPSAVGGADGGRGDGTVPTLAAGRRARRGSPRDTFRSGSRGSRGRCSRGTRRARWWSSVPVRFDGYRQQLVLAERVRVRARVLGGRGGGGGPAASGGGAAPPRRRRRSATPWPGCYTCRTGPTWWPSRTSSRRGQRALAVSALRLQRQGLPVPFHVEPDADSVRAGQHALLPRRHEAPLDRLLVRGRLGAGALDRGAADGRGPAPPRPGLAVGLTPTAGRAVRGEPDLPAGLLEAPDLWLWDAVPSGAVRCTRSRSAAWTPRRPGSRSSCVHLQGGSDAVEAPQDHHVRVRSTAIDVGETLFDGRAPSAPRSRSRRRSCARGRTRSPSSNVGDTGVSSLVFSTASRLAHPQLARPGRDAFEGVVAPNGHGRGGGVSPDRPWSWTSTVGDARADVAGGLGRGSRRRAIPRRTGATLRRGHARGAPRAAGREGPASRRCGTRRNQADYLLIGPRDFLETARAAPRAAARARG